MLNAIGDSVSNVACSNHVEDREDDDDDKKDSEFSMLCEDDKSSWVIVTFSNTVHQHMESCLQ